MNWLKKALIKMGCFFGVHAWKYNRPERSDDAFPCFFDKTYTQWLRKCARCGKQQYWLPGYGGSEWGCWMPNRGLFVYDEASAK